MELYSCVANARDGECLESRGDLVTQQMAVPPKE